MSLEDLDYIEFKELDRFRLKPLKHPTCLKMQLISYVEQVFAELQYLFSSNLHQKFVYTLLNETLTTNAIASIHMTYLLTSLKLPLIATSLQRMHEN